MPVRDERLKSAYLPAFQVQLSLSAAFQALEVS